MNKMEYAKGITAEDLRMFLGIMQKQGSENLATTRLANHTSTDTAPRKYIDTTVQE